MRLDGEQIFGYGFVVFILGIGFIILTALLQDHKVRCYYPKANGTNAGIAYKIYGDVNWAEDHLAFTTPHKDEMFEVLDGMKQCAIKEEIK